MFFLSGILFPFIAIKNKKWNIYLVCVILYYFGIANTIILYGVTYFLFLTIGQLSHVQHECISDDERKNDFLYNQVTSSVNYKTDDMFTRFICFGLDIQIEHHLFPNIPHSSLRRIKPIVRDYCDKHGIPYIEKSSIFPTMYSYDKYLYNIGNNIY